MVIFCVIMILHDSENSMNISVFITELHIFFCPGQKKLFYTKNIDI